VARKSIITIDGPGGSGKSTVARKLAQRLGFAFLDSGAIYRAATCFALDRGLDIRNASEVVQALDGFGLRLEERPSGMLVFVNSVDITNRIRSREVSNSVYHLANSPEVRRRLIGVQRAFGEQQSLVAEGRDMGTVVFPDADLKFYLHASLEVRALRRLTEVEAMGERVDLKNLKEEIRKRDERDMNRPVAPLRKPEEAVVIDSSGLSVEEVLDAMVRVAGERGIT
jgi:cytidylate kinase